MTPFPLAVVQAFGIDTLISGEFNYLIPSGRVITKEWNSKTSVYDYFEVEPDEIGRFGFEPIKLAPNVKLVDVLECAERYPAFIPFLGRYAKDYMEHGINQMVPAAELDGDIEFLEVYHMASLEERHVYDLDGEIKEKVEGSTMTGTFFPNFHGIGPELQEDDPERFTKKGERIHWGLMGSHIKELSALPLVLNPKFPVYDAFNGSTKVFECSKEFTLFEVLKAIFWEISWFGHPDEKLEVDDEEE